MKETHVLKRGAELTVDTLFGIHQFERSLVNHIPAGHHHKERM